MRILFAGSSSIALPSLETLSRHFDIVGVLSNPESSHGRGLQRDRTPVSRMAAQLGLPVLEPERLDSQARAAITALAPDLLVVFAYGKIFGPRFLSLFPRGAINVHPSLLPRYRGCAPIQAAILNQDRQTGVVVQRVALEVDSGDILASEPMALDGRETTESLQERSAAVGARLLEDVIRHMLTGEPEAHAQDHSQATWCTMIRKEDGLINWNDAAGVIDAKVRAFYPWPGAFSSLHGTRLSIIETCPYPDETQEALPGTMVCIDKSRGIMVQTGKGLLALVCLQLEARKAMNHRNFANGSRALSGTVLGV